MKQYKYKNEKGEIEMIDSERWGWGVVYKDETELHQFDKEGNFHRLAEIDQSRVHLFVMYKLDESGKRYDIVMPEGARIIHKYRNIRPYYMNKFVKVYMFGWRQGHNKKDFQYHFNFILPNGTLVQGDKNNIDLSKFPLNDK